MLFQLVEQYGPEADRHLFRCLFSHVDFSGDGRSSGKDFHQVRAEWFCCSFDLRTFYDRLVVF